MSLRSLLNYFIKGGEKIMLNIKKLLEEKKAYKTATTSEKWQILLDFCKFLHINIYNKELRNKLETYLLK